MARLQPKEGRVDKLLATELVKRYTHSRPVDVQALANALGLRVVETPLPDDISGKIERDWVDGDGFMITLNSNHAPVRRRFTLAHEIAHFVLHRDLIGDGIVDNGLYRDNRIGDERERQANTYAAQILMPRNLVRQAWNEGLTSAAELAAAFRVSAGVAEIRMRELGCRLWPSPAPVS
jgi:Zn-dependent peptidase ImmA (M78 family)